MDMGVEHTVRPIAVADLDAVARIHELAFPDSALTSLGTELVRRYYEWQLIGPHDALALGVFENGELLGFCFGGIFRGALSGFLRQNRAYLTWRVAQRPWLLASPFFRGRLRFGVRLLARMDARRRRARKAAASHGRQPPAGSAPVTTPAFGILSIAVHPARKSSGIGKRLMEQMEARAHEHRFGRMRLTVSPDNHSAVRFYERLGWTRDIQEDGWHGGMWKTLGTARLEAIPSRAVPRV